ncbi:cyd operon protein YbgE [Mesocricetibacter intestinalis]|uniref:Cyd operon protein YbgE n=1 Tax=Mesocricetibacter intestinalis TaxID=1521930 RepID=A0A4R6VDB5_9PAST|nr:cyd operon protein YbgE [Mesocricetibacter intestinalis]TDQ59876.1 cyd operon protein YbgE [Mesocricetibacter intestinalis]
MRDLFYQLFNKGSWRALSLILALMLTVFFFFNIDGFSDKLRSTPVYWVILNLWATVILWIHGMGFGIRSLLWRYLFAPVVGYAVTAAVIVTYLLNISR